MYQYITRSREKAMALFSALCVSGYNTALTTGADPATGKIAGYVLITEASETEFYVHREALVSSFPHSDDPLNVQVPDTLPEGWFPEEKETGLE